MHTLKMFSRMLLMQEKKKYINICIRKQYKGLSVAK